MVSYNTYPPLPSTLPEAPGPCLVEVPLQVVYYLNVVQAKRQRLINKEKMFKKKLQKVK